MMNTVLRYAAILFKKQKYVSGQHRVNLKIVCRENYKYEVQEKSPANQAVTMQQLAEEYWRGLLPSVPEKHAHANGIFWFLKKLQKRFCRILQCDCFFL